MDDIQRWAAECVPHVDAVVASLVHSNTAVTAYARASIHSTSAARPPQATVRTQLV